MKESQPEAVLDRLQDFGVLKQIDPELICDDWLHTRFERLRMNFKPEFWDMNLTVEDNLFLHWAVLLYRVSKPAFARISTRLPLPRRVVKSVQDFARFKEHLPKLSEEIIVSEAVSLLDSIHLDLLAVVWLCTESKSAADILLEYARKWRHVQPILGGDDLKAMGFKPGPLYRDILVALKVAHLEGNITTEAEERALVRQNFNTIS